MALPPGFVLEQPSGINLPSGFVLEGQQPAEERSGALSAGFKSYLPQLQETFGGVKTLLGVGAERALGEGEISRGLIESGARSMKEAEEARAPLVTPERGSFTDALDKGVGAVLTEWLPFQVGSGAAQLLEALTLAGAGAVAGSVVGTPGVGTATGAVTGVVARELAKKGVKEAAEKILKERGEDAAKEFFEQEAKKAAIDIGKRRGVNIALAGQAGFYGAGQTTSRAVEEAERLGGTATDIELARVLPAAAVSAAAEFIGDKILLGAVKDLAPGKAGKSAKLDLAKNILLGIVSTGTKEVPVEVIQSAAERYGAKLSLDDAKAIKEYVDAAAASYAMSVVPGGVRGVRTTMAEQAAKREEPEVEPPAPEAPPAPPAPPRALEFRPEPLIVYPDGSVAKRSEIDAYIQGLPEDEQIPARAKLLGMGEEATQVTTEMLRKLGIRGRAPIIQRLSGLELTDPKVQEELTSFAQQPFASPEVRGNIFGFLNTIKATSATPVAPPPVSEAPTPVAPPVEPSAPLVTPFAPPVEPAPVVEAAAPTATPSAPESDQKALEEKRQMVADMIETKKANREVVPEAWIKKLADLSAQLRGETIIEGETYSMEVAGHPLFDGPPVLRNLIPIKVKDSDAAQRALDRALDLEKQFATEFYGANQALKSARTASEKKAAQARIKKLNDQGWDEDALQTLRNETIKELSRLVDVTQKAELKAEAPKKGDFVKLTVPGVGGPINRAGKVERVLPNGDVEVRTQQGEIVSKPAGEVTVVTTNKAELTQPPPFEPSAGKILPLTPALQGLNKGQLELYNFADAIEQAKKPITGYDYETVVDRKEIDDRVSTPESLMRDLTGNRNSLKNIDGKIRSGNRTSATYRTLIDAWVTTSQVQNRIDQSKRENPELWKAYEERQRKLQDLDVGDEVETFDGERAVIDAKFGQNWRIAFPKGGRGRLEGEKTLVPPSALRPVEEAEPKAEAPAVEAPAPVAEALKAEPTTLTTQIGGSYTTLDLGKPVWQATDEDLVQAVKDSGAYLGKPGSKYDPYMAWREAHNKAIQQAKREGKPFPPEVLYDNPRLIRDDLSDNQADEAIDAMVDVYRATKDYGKAVEAYRNFGKKPAVEAPAAPAKLAAPEVHEDQGVVEPATPEVIEEAADKGKQNTNLSPAEMRKNLTDQIDRAIASAPETDDADITVGKMITSRGKKEVTVSRVFDTGNVDIKARELRDGVYTVEASKFEGGMGGRKVIKLDNIGGPPASIIDQLTELARRAQPDATVAEGDYVTFEVPGDGTFRVLNNKSRLAEFRKKVESNPGFKAPKKPAPSTAPIASASKAAAIKDMIDGGDPQAAVDYAAATGVDINDLLKNDRIRRAAISGLEPTKEEVEPSAKPARLGPSEPTGQERTGRANDRKSLGGARRTKLGFYSELENRIEQMGPKAAPAAQWKNMINALVQKGVKPDEIQWTGVTDWLDLQEGKVSKVDLINYLKQGGVQVEETVLKDKRGLPDEIIEDIGNRFWPAVTASGLDADVIDESMERGDLDVASLPAELREDAQILQNDLVARRGGITKYGQYTLPGGENYREVLLTLPKTPGPESAEVKLNEANAFKRAMREKYGNGWLQKATPQELERNRMLSFASAEAPSVQYRSTHWKQPNVLAHIRMNDRTDADGKRVLFVEEIQSDWGQEGKKRGFGANLKDGYAIVEQEPGFFHLRQAGREYPIAIGSRANIEQEGRAKGAYESGVPAAPFVTKTEGWLNLALKRIMVMAAEGGYDKVAFVNGEQSADRFSLDKQVDELHWRTSNGLRRATLDMKSGDSLTFNLDESGVVKSVEGTGETRYVGKGFDEIVGKELAEKVLSEPRGVLSGNGLKVGGEGMKTFYDTIVPTAVKKLLPKLGGGQVSRVNFGEGGYTLQYEDGSRLDESMTLAEAQEAAEDRGAEVVPLGGMQQLGFDITPAMREKVEGGLPLFSLEQTKGQRNNFFNELRQLLNKFGLKDVALKIEQDMQEAGTYARELIRIADRADNPIRTLRHEAIHALRELGFFTDAQWKSLSKMAKDKWIDQYLKQRNVDGKPLKAGEESRYDAYMREYDGDMEKITEEAVADAFADFDATKPPAGLLQTLLRRLRDFFQAMKSALTKVESVDQIFGKVEEGKLRPGEKAETGERKSIGGIRAKAAKAKEDIIAAGREAGQKRKLDKGAFEGVNEDLFEKLKPVFAPRNVTIQDRIIGMRDNFWQRVAQGMADQFRTIKDYSYDAYMKARLSKSIDGGVEGLMFYGQVFNDGGALNIKKNTRGMFDILKPVGKELDRYLIYIALSRDAALPESKRSIDPDLVARRGELIDGTLNGKPRKEVYEQVRKDMNLLNRSVLKVAVDSGLLNTTEGAIKDIEANENLTDEQKREKIAELRKNPIGYERFINDLNYIPFYKIMEDGDTDSVAKAVSASGLTSQYFSKALKGGEKPFGDLMENTLKNWSHILSASMKNQAAVAAMDAAVKAGVAVPNLKPQYDFVDGKVVFRKNGEVVGDGSIRADMTESEKGAVKIVVDGKNTYYNVSDPLLMDSITSIGFLGTQSKFLDVARDFKNLLQYGVTISPQFRVNNLIRDAVGAMGVSELRLNPVANVLQGVSLSDRSSPTYIAAMAGGGVFNFGTAYEGDQSKMIKRLLKMGVDRDHILDSDSKIANGLKYAWDKYQEWGNKAENANRLALYQQLRDKGMSHLEATFKARDLMDFSMQGSWPAFRVLTQVIPFLNARIQGLYKLGRDGISPTARVINNTITGKPIEASDKQKAQQFSIVLMGVTLASALLYLTFKDDEEYKRRDDWDKDNFWWFRVPGMEFALRVPKPFEIGAFGTVVERTLEQILDSGAEGKEFGDALFRMLTNTFAINPIPQVFKPLVDIYANKDSFTGAPIESAGLERLSKQERMVDTTSPLAIALGKVSSLFPETFEISPVQADYLIKGYLGWLGGTIAAISTYATMPFKEGEYPDARWMDRLSLGLARELPGRGAKFVTAFYESNKEIAQAYADMRHYATIGDSHKVQELLEEKGDKIRLAKFYDNVATQMANIRKQIRLTQNDKLMDGAAKKEAIDRMQDMIAMLAKQAEDIRKQQKLAK